MRSKANLLVEDPNLRELQNKEPNLKVATKAHIHTSQSYVSLQASTFPYTEKQRQ